MARSAMTGWRTGPGWARNMRARISGRSATGGSACVPYDAGMSDDGTEQVLMQQAQRPVLQ